MARVHAGTVLRHLRRLAPAPGGAALPDGELLRRWLARRDEAAFELLLYRHGPMVLGVCRRLLPGAADAEDAFQATFLTLVRKGGGIGRRNALGAWLYKVAYRVALLARQTAGQTAGDDARTVAADPAAEDAAERAARREQRRLVLEEVARLPAKYRAAVVLCHLEGRTQEDAAAELGWPKGTVSTRLTKARALLRARLVRRGLAPGAAGVAALLAAGHAAAVPDGLITATAGAACRVAAGGAVPHGAARALALAAGAARAAPLARLKAVAAAVLAAGVLSAAGLAGKQSAAPAEAVPPPAAEAPRAAARPAAADHYGDPLPPGALLRLGTTRLRQGIGFAKLAFTPDGKTLVVLGDDGSARFCDAATGRDVRTLRGLGVHPLALSPDGKTIACQLAEGDGTVVLRDAATGKEAGRLAAHRDGVGLLAFSPDGRFLASAWQGEVAYEKIATRKVVWRGKGFAGTLAFSPDGKTLAVAGGLLTSVRPGEKPRAPEGGEIRLWEAATGRPLRSWGVDDPAADQAAFTPDGNTLVTTDGEMMTLWDARTGKSLRRIPQPAAAGRSGAPLAVSPDGKLLAWAGPDYRIRLWDAGTGAELQGLRGHVLDVRALAFAPDGKTLASAAWDSTVRLWDVATGGEKFPRDEQPGAICGAVSPDGRTLATGGGDGSVRFWDAATGIRRAEVRGHAGAVYSVAPSPDGRTLASGGADGVAILWDVATGRELRRFRGPEGGVAVTFSPDGKTLAAKQGEGNAVVLWDVRDGRELRRIPKRYVVEAAFSPDGKILAAGGYDGKVHLWDAASGKELRQLKPPSPPADPPRGANTITLTIEGKEGPGINTVAFAPDGKTLASAGRDGQVRLWDVASGRELRHAKGPGGCVSQVAFTPDGRTLAAVGEDGSVQLLETATTREVHRLVGHRGGAVSLAFFPDGKRLLTGSTDATALVWTLDPGAGSGGRDGAEDLGRLWEELGAEDAARAYRAGWRLVGAGGRAVEFLKDRLRPAAAFRAEKIGKLVAGLDDPAFAAREAAARELARLGDEAEPALRTARSAAPSAEARRRIDKLLDALPGAVPDRDMLREMRAVAVLERVGSGEAVTLLRRLAGGRDFARLTREARAALGRLGK